MQHALSYTKGGLPIHRHNDVRDLNASLMEEVSRSTEKDPMLQPIIVESLCEEPLSTEAKPSVA